MPIIYFLIGALGLAAKSLVGRVLLALGLSFVTFKGQDVIIGWLLEQIKSNMAGMPVQIVAFFAWMWVDKAIAMVFSAFATAAVIRAVSGDSVTKVV